MKGRLDVYRELVCELMRKAILSLLVVYPGESMHMDFADRPGLVTVTGLRPRWDLGAAVGRRTA